MSYELRESNRCLLLIVFKYSVKELNKNETKVSFYLLVLKPTSNGALGKALK